jgi:hypothetical protein
MATGQQIVSNALRHLGMLEQGGTPSVSDSVDTLTALNVMWDAWGIDEGLIYAQYPARFPWGASVAAYTIGPGAALDLPQRPARIYRPHWVTVTGGAIATSTLASGGVGYAAGDTGIVLDGNGTPAAYLVATVDGTGAVLTYSLSYAGTGHRIQYGAQTKTAGAHPGAGVGFSVNVLTLTTSAVMNRQDLDLVPPEGYFAHNDLGATAGLPDELYIDWRPDGNGYYRAYTYPIPSVAGTLELEISAPFSAWTLTDNYNVPEGFQDPLEWALAFRCLADFGAAVAPEVAAVVQAVGGKAENRIREMNRINRQMQPGAEAVPAPPAAQGAMK